MSPLDIVLILIVAAQQWFWMRNTHKLLDKLMSRDFHDYQVTKQYEAPPPPPPAAPQDLGPLEDMRVLESFSM